MLISDTEHPLYVVNMGKPNAVQEHLKLLGVSHDAQNIEVPSPSHTSQAHSSGAIYFIVNKH